MLNRVMVKIRGETTFYSNKVVSQLSKEKTQSEASCWSISLPSFQKSVHNVASGMSAHKLQAIKRRERH